MMKLYYFPIAPNPTKVRLYLAEKAAAGTAIDVEEVRVDLTRQEQKSAEHLARNPFGNLPVLEIEIEIEIERDSYLLESLAIIEYLEDLHPEPAMIGRDPLERARVREIDPAYEQLARWDREYRARPAAASVLTM